MKLIHLSDLHLGKRLNNFPLLDDQEYILIKILSVINSENPDAVIIAGDIYDNSAPSAQAVSLFDSFLTKLAAGTTHVFIISGNHDSAERISFGNRLMDASGVHIAPVYDGKVCPYELKDEFGAVRFYMLPFIRPSDVRHAFPDVEISSYTDAVSKAIEAMNVDTSLRNVLIAHQFVTGASTCDSEEYSVGGLDNIDASVFNPFDYTALGHIHSPQNISKDPLIRYCGTPLKYSISEKDQDKSVTVIELEEKGSISIREISLTPRLDLREIRGSYDEITAKSFYEGTNTQDYLRIILTDEDEIPYASNKLKIIYPNIMKLEYDNSHSRTLDQLPKLGSVENKSPADLFSEFFNKQRGTDMSDEQTELINTLVQKIWGGEGE